MLSALGESRSNCARALRNYACSKGSDCSQHLLALRTGRSGASDALGRGSKSANTLLATAPQATLPQAHCRPGKRSAADRNHTGFPEGPADAWGRFLTGPPQHGQPAVAEAVRSRTAACRRNHDLGQTRPARGPLNSQGQSLRSPGRRRKLGGVRNLRNAPCARCHSPA